MPEISLVQASLQLEEKDVDLITLCPSLPVFLLSWQTLRNSHILNVSLITYTGVYHFLLEENVE